VRKQGPEATALRGSFSSAIAVLAVATRRCHPADQPVPAFRIILHWIILRSQVLTDCVKIENSLENRAVAQPG
jgi:hypothetical protein